MPLLVFHVYKKDEDPRNYKVSNVNIVQYTNAEIAQIRDDWNLIKNKVSMVKLTKYRVEIHCFLRQQQREVKTKNM